MFGEAVMRNHDLSQLLISLVCSEPIMDALSLIVIGFQLDEGRVTCGDIRHGNPSRPSETVIGGDQ